MQFLDILIPPACAGCGRPRGLLCQSCRSLVREPSPARDRFLAPDAGMVIGEALILGIAAFSHEGPMRRAIASLKYSGVSRMAPILAGLAERRARDLLPIAGPAALVPVPVHVHRLRERGYNQSTLLAREIGRRAGLPVVEVLVRTRPTTRQHRLSRADRLNNLRGVFAASGHPPRTAILVDDIITTTATLEACAAVLMDTGCEAVYGFAIAREV